MKTIFPGLCATVVLLVLSAGASHGILNSFFEDFTTDTYKTFHTTADWNTTDGELRLPPFSPSLVGSYATAQNVLNVVVDGDYAYMANTSDGLQILDISNPAAPTLVGAHFTPASVTDICVAGELVFLAMGSAGVRVLDVTNPAGPLLLDVYNPAASIADIFVAGDIAYMATGSTFDLVDISDPTTLVLVGSYNHAGFGFGVVVEGNYAYHTNSGASLQIVDVSNSASPFLAGSIATSQFPSGIDVEGNYAYACQSSYGVEIFDITDPTAPLLAGAIPLAGGARRALVTGDLLYVAGLTAGLHVYDITDPANPALMFTHDTPGIANGVAVSGEHAFIADQGSGLQVVKVRTITPPTLSASYTSLDNVAATAVSGNTAIILGESSNDDVAHVLDITNPFNPILIDSYFPPNGSFWDVCIDGDYAFLAASNAIYIFDFSDPSNMVLLSTYNPQNFADGIAVSGDLLFVADRAAGLTIVDITDPSSPSLLGSYNTAGYAVDVFVAGDYAFVADGGPGLLVVDVSDPTAPTLTGSVALANDVVSVTVAGNHAYVANQGSGVSVIDVSNPASPALVTSLGLGSWTYDVFVDGNYAFAAAAGLHILDISNPASPSIVDTYSPGGGLEGVIVDGDHAFISEFYGMRILRVFQGEWDTAGNIGRSFSLDSADDLIMRARLTATETPGVSWEMAGSVFDPVTANNAWHLFSAPTTSVSWRATLNWTGTSPIVSDLRIEWLTELARIESVSDIPNDQGRQARVTWTRSGHDFVGDPSQIVEYAVYREIDPNLTTSAAAAPRSFEHLSPAGREHALQMAATGWDYLVTVPVRVQDSYSVVVPTLADSTIAKGDYQTTFMVSAITATPGVFFDSHPDSGHSTDNLAPSVPANLVIAHNTGSGNALAWDESPEADFQYFRVYRSTSPDFTPGENTLVHSTNSTGWVDPDNDGGAVYYKVTATDFSGNESDAAESGTVTSVPSQPTPNEWALDANVPNPFNPTTQIRYTVPAGGGDVSLRIFDVRGRLVRTLVDGTGAPGQNTVTWDGRDMRGQSVASGVYFYRLQGKGFTSTRKMLLAK